MKPDYPPLSRRVESLTRRYPYLGPMCWILTVQYFIAQIVVAAAARSDYNWGIDPISHLGITECAVFRAEYVCSPLHAIFNLSLLVLGAATAIGALLLHHQFGRNRGSLVGCGALAIAALGTVLVGIFPANTIDVVHSLGTGLSLIGGLTGVLVLSATLHGLPRLLRYVLVCNGTISAVGVILLALIFFLGVGAKGLAERVTSYPQVLWLIVFGAYCLVRHFGGYPPWMERMRENGGGRPC